MKRRLLAAAAALASVYLAIVAGLFVVQRSLVFPAPPVLEPKLQQGTVLKGPVFATWRPPPEGAPTFVYFHGNGSQLADIGSWLSDELGSQVGFFAIEYPGYGIFPGAPSEEGLYAAAEAGLEHLTGPLGIPREQLILVGQSLGTGVAVEMAKRGWGTRLVLITPYTTIPDVAAGTFWWLPVRALLKDRFDSLSKAPALKLPVLVVHGTRDTVVPYELGVQLSKAFPNAKLLTIPEGTHFDLWNRPEVVSAVLAHARN